MNKWIDDDATKDLRLLQGKKVYLRPVEVEDAMMYYSTMNDPEMRRLTGTQAVFSLAGVQSYLERKATDASSVLLWIGLQDTNELVGDIALQDMDTTNRNANLRIAIGNTDHQGKGYGSEAIRLLLGYGFGILNLHRIELNVFSYNDRAIHVYEKVGFVREGVQRQVLYYNHAYHDSIWMSILADEFRQQG